MEIKKSLSKKNTDGKGGKTVEEIFGKKELAVYIPNEISHTGHLVEEVKFEHIKCYVEKINSYIDFL